MRGTGKNFTPFAVLLSLVAGASGGADYRDAAALVRAGLLERVEGCGPDCVESGWLAQPTEIGGIKIAEGRVYFHPDGRIRQGKPARLTRLGRAAFSTEWRMRFYPAGQVREGMLAGPLAVGAVSLPGGTIACLRRDGTVESYILPRGADNPKVGGKAIGAGFPVYLYPDGAVAGARLAEHAFVRGVRVPRGTMANFSRDGGIEAAIYRDGISDNVETVGTKYGTINVGTCIYFHPGGTPRFFFALDKTVLSNVGRDKRFIHVEPGGIVFLDAAGNLGLCETEGVMVFFSPDGEEVRRNVLSDSDKWIPFRPYAATGFHRVGAERGLLEVAGSGSGLGVEAVFPGADMEGRATLRFEARCGGEEEAFGALAVMVEDGGLSGRAPGAGARFWRLAGDSVPDGPAGDTYPGIAIDGGRVRAGKWQSYTARLGSVRGGVFKPIGLAKDRFHRVAIFFEGEVDGVEADFRNIRLDK